MAIVNGFDTKVLQSRLARDSHYEVYCAFGGYYYITDGYFMIQCKYDMIEKIKDYLGMMVPEENHGYVYRVDGGWEESPIKTLDKYLKICDVNYHGNHNVSERPVVEMNQIDYERREPSRIYCHPAIVCELDNGDKVLLNKMYVDIMAKAKKWGWYARGVDPISPVHFLNVKNTYELWIMPVRYKTGAI